MTGRRNSDVHAVTKKVGAGLLGGVARTLVSYPFSTVNVWRQTGRAVDLRPASLYRGVQVPIVTGAMLSAVLVNCEAALYHITGNHVVSGGLTGVLCTLLTAPLDFVRIRKQCANPGTIMSKSIGWRVSATREGISGACFFGTFHAVK